MVIIADSKITKKKETIIKNAWMKLPINASKNRKIFILNSDYVTIPSWRVIYLIDDLIQIMQKK